MKSYFYVTISVTGPYKRQTWRSVLLNFHKVDKKSFVDLYVNCRKIIRKEINFNIKNAPTENLELRLGQREIAGKIFSRYKVGLIQADPEGMQNF